MTHGEEPGSEMHQDSVVLTYLEGLLMHQVEGGLGAAATRRSDVGHSVQDQNNKPASSYLLPSHGSCPEERRTGPGSGTQHLKKARLLQSTEAWSAPERHRLPDPAVDLNGQSRELLTGALGDSPKCKQESTLLASLLQSFSSRLQSVALSQQIMQSLQHQGYPRSDESAPDEEEALGCYGIASSRLKGLMKRKNKVPSRSSVPYRRRNSQERASESPQAAPPASEPLSCAARLKAVASLVEHRSSPAASPKPSVACSQLALLLSSEAHLQQYSREQALKSKLAVRSASERLAAIASQKQQDNTQTQLPNSSPLNGQCGSLLKSADSSKHNPTPSPGHSSSSRNPSSLRDRGSFVKPSPRASPYCSSLLLQLLNNHNTQKQVNGHRVMEGSYHAFPNHSSPALRSAREYSNQDNSLTEDSSDAESFHSRCSPIDLSLRARASRPSFGSAGSLETLTESLISNWNPETPRLHTPETRPRENASVTKPYQKVTLLQLLLDHKNNEKTDMSSDKRELQKGFSPEHRSAPAESVIPVRKCEESMKRSSPDALNFGKVETLPKFHHSQEAAVVASSPSASLYSLRPPSRMQGIPAPTPLLDLRKSSNDNTSAGGAGASPHEAAQEASFSASKLLQNLAQCGLQNSAQSLFPSQPSVLANKRQTFEMKADKPVALLERLSAPVTRNTSPVLEEASMNMRKPASLAESCVASRSEIENLLERRSVLQLLMGTGDSKEKTLFKRKRSASKVGLPERQPSQSYSSGDLIEPVLQVKIKTEPKEETSTSEYECEADTSQSEERSEKQHSPVPLPVSAPPRDMKQEPGTIAQEPIPRDGLLSQLLKQPPSAYHANKHTGGNMNNLKETQTLNQGTVVPKKRKLCLSSEEHFLSPVRMEVSNEQHTSSMEPLCKPSEKRLSRDTGTQVEVEAVGHVGCSASESPGCAKDGKDFNVLKQLLLSDNCLKDLSQPRGTASSSVLQNDCKPNGRLKYSPETSSFQRNLSLPASGPLDLKISQSAPVGSSPRSGSPWGGHVARQESPQLNLVPVNSEAEGPIRWVIRGDDKCDVNKDYPRLTKSNPILYYMLQKGNSSLSKEGKQRRAQVVCPSEPVQYGLHVQIKQEPTSEEESYNHGLNLKRYAQSRLHKNHNGGLSDILEKVPAVKTESD
ncbi:nuclear receptor-interacting protein 1-like [Polyodon spathula]|uniref:nuclear receptor-interacting protein 1-like n=1 Tax=Polyodon spathula TaxID=7913 RepID=UPI001B7F423A|nr:nuclear receptor-interacting protein 1-like [Polyodon spathula]XP_041088653.1 nuclear receptor-interacting protein 1-like [Polyodon spathula]XP_041088654.1 nuclear receptor-interacting protein 1-like [Polyodon spathula]XP_041088655.1 nuclear receptor-interacting protein 1-like [Polyodon spathula]XP_041088656.1 nuclear receptor-interacting protein 1-like [Polyodon spathula]XP_041088658.1 nuclear receptor-interacting protein 1-like [Polyodon spathula]XP_041088659.1 nuclear receptor-interacti